MKPSGKKGIYEIIWDLESFAKKFSEGSGDRIFIENVSQDSVLISG